MTTVKTEQIMIEHEDPASVVKTEQQKIVKTECDTVKKPVKAPFELKEYYKKALLKLLYCHHTDQTLTYIELSSEIGVGEKTKAWQCEAWRDLKKHEYIVKASNNDGGKPKFQLSPKGVELATSLASDEELAEYKMPETNEEHHEKIKSKLLRQDKKAHKYGPKIFDYLVETHDDDPMTKHEIAEHFNTLADSHHFFYGFQALQKMGMITKVSVPAGSKGSRKRKKTDEEDTSKDEKKEITNLQGTEDDAGTKKKKKKRSGGAPWKLTEKAFLRTVSNKND